MSFLYKFRFAGKMFLPKGQQTISGEHAKTVKNYRFNHLLILQRDVLDKSIVIGDLHYKEIVHGRLTTVVALATSSLPETLNAAFAVFNFVPA